MSVIDTIMSAADEFPARFERAGGGVLTMKTVVAQRKVFLSKRTLEYRCRLRVDDEARQVTFFEILMEKGAGVSGGDMDTAPGFGFRKETYKTGAATRSGTIEEQSRLFAKRLRVQLPLRARARGGAAGGRDRRLRVQAGAAREERLRPTHTGRGADRRPSAAQEGGRGAVERPAPRLFRAAMPLRRAAPGRYGQCRRRGTISEALVPRRCRCRPRSP